MSKSTLCIVVAFVVTFLIIVGATIGVFKHASTVDKNKLVEDVLSASEDIESQSETQVEEEIIEEDYKGPEIYQGDAREVAVMIDNETAVTSHAGLNSAYMLYEFIIEGGESRIMAFFKGTMPDKIGPVRSSRHYFLDYALEHDAIYVHFGWSPKAQSDIKTLGINNINGIYDDFYWREAPKSSYHNAFTSMENILRFAGYKKYRTTTDKGPIIEYNKKDTDLESENVANKVYIKYSNLQSTTYTYNETEKIYLRSKRDYEHKDRFTGERFYAKNIIAVYVEDQLLPDTEDKGRRELYNIGTGDGYFITNGKSIPITWTKTSRSSRTIYKDLNGNEIKLNDGITWVQIVPITGKIEIN